MSPSNPVRATIGVVGELAVTVGVVVVLFVVWQLGYEGVVQAKAQSGVVSELEQQFVAPHSNGISGAGGGTGTGNAAPTSIPPELLPDGGAPFAILRVPRLGGPTWSKPVFQGTGLDVLAQGLGHYTETQLPGQVGNVAIAGHRAGHGNPLINIDAIRPGDVMVLETRFAYYVYRVTGHEIVPPTHVQVLDAVPNEPGAAPTTAEFTLTSCDPRYGSTNRYIVYSQLEQTIPHDQGLPAGLLDHPSGA